MRVPKARALPLLPMLPWFLLVGAVLIVMALSGRLVQRLPLSPAIIYLGVGAIVGPYGLALLPVDPLDDAPLVETLTEIAVLITLFAVGLRLRLPLRSTAWAVPLRLAGAGMVITAVLAALAAHWVLGLSFGAALLLGAVLAPTDPVLASDVQIREPGDRDAVRVSITAEGGINDGAAFPAVMLALAMLGLHDIGSYGWRWLAFDLLWPASAGLLLGWGCGLALGRVLGAMRRSGSPPEAEEFLVFGTITLTYGLALLLHTYGFVAVFAAGAALARAEHQSAQGPTEAQPDPHADPSHSLQLLRFAGQCERLAEVAMVLVIGAALASVQWQWPLLVYAAVLLLVVRPLAVMLVVPRRCMPRAQRRLVAWFGIRGVGSLYYLAYAIHRGVPHHVGDVVADAALVTIAASILAHGISATPLMERYRRRRSKPGMASAGNPGNTPE
jgi:NhaP-type Na+/H+ or K+/H+ antiporter